MVFFILKCKNIILVVQIHYIFSCIMSFPLARKHPFKRLKVAHEPPADNHICSCFEALDILLVSHSE